MEEYFRAKKLLFDSLSDDAVAVTNCDDEWGRTMVSSTRARSISFGTSEAADARATDIQLSLDGTSFKIRFENREREIVSPLVGRFNVYNTLAAYTSGLALEFPMKRSRREYEISRM